MLRAAAVSTHESPLHHQGCADAAAVSTHESPLIISPLESSHHTHSSHKITRCTFTASQQSKSQPRPTHTPRTHTQPHNHEPPGKAADGDGGSHPHLPPRLRGVPGERRVCVRGRGRHLVARVVMGTHARTHACLGRVELRGLALGTQSSLRCTFALSP